MPEIALRAGVVHFVDVDVDVDDVTPEQGWIRADIAGMPVGPVAGAGLGSSLSIGRRGQVVIGVPGLGPRRSGAVLIAAGPGSWQLADQETRGIADRAEAGDTFGATLAGWSMGRPLRGRSCRQPRRLLIWAM